MKRQPIAQIVNNQLMRLDTNKGKLPPIPVGAQDWYTWLNAQEARSFAYRTSDGTMTVRRESRHGGWYWYAYRLQGTKLRKVYLGKAENLTPQRLNAAVYELANPQATQPDQAPIQPASRPTTLLKTKLALPPAPPHLLSRVRLFHLLESSPSRVLTLVCAPAGFGKTTLLGDWARKSKSSVLWLTLGSEENDPHSFLLYLTTALRAQYPDIIEKVSPSLHRQRSSLGDTLSNFINELAALPEALTLILDNYHLIKDAALHKTLRSLLEHLPSHIHLIIATRRELPFSLARLYVGGQVADLRADALRFSSEETHTFLAQAMPSLSADEIVMLEEQTEGWIAGLQFAVLTKQSAHHSTHSLTALGAKNRYIEQYVIEEVLGSQPAHLQTFLLQTALLERFNGPLCNILTGRTDAQELLAELEREQLFIFPLQEHEGWYRYQRLFARTMRHFLEQTQPDALPLLHQRASQWFEQQGMLKEAIHHSLAAQDVERAASFLEQIAHSLLGNEELSALQGWLDALPLPIIRASPRLCILSAWLIFLTTQADAFLHWLDAAEEALHAQEEYLQPGVVATLQGEIVALRTTQTIYFNDFHGAVDACNQVLASLPPDSLYARSLVLMMLGLAYQRGVNVAAAARVISEATDSSQALGDGLLLPYAMIAQAELYIVLGYPFQAMKVYHQVLEVTNERIGHPTGLVYASLGYLYWEWQDREMAQQYLLQAWDIGVQVNNLNIIFNTTHWLAIIAQTQGHASEAQYWLQQLEAYVQKARVFKVLNLVAVLRAWLALDQGHLEEALLWMQNRMSSPAGEIPLRTEIEYFIQVRVLLAASRASGDASYLQEALTILEHIRKEAETIGKTKTLIEVLTFHALVHYFQEDMTAALSVLERAISLAEPGRYIRMFVDKGDPMAKLLRQLRDHYKSGKSEERMINLAYVRRLLAAFTPSGSGPSHPAYIASTEALPLLEPLSWREREVLRLMDAGKKNQEIARELVIATGTVKAHISSIYRKLVVNSRIQALSRARTLHLL